MYRPVDPKVSFPSIEEKVLAFWQENRTFEKSISQRDGAEEFVFYDGPPFATGLPHYGHFIPSTVKDVIPRYQTMKDYASVINVITQNKNVRGVSPFVFGPVLVETAGNTNRASFFDAPMLRGFAAEFPLRP